jgi:hypothetical protein
MKRSVQALYVSIVLCIAAAEAAPTAVVTFSRDGLSFEQYVHGEDTFQIPHVAGASLGTDSVGAPYMPFKTVLLLIPQDRTCTGVNVTSGGNFGDTVLNCH